MKLTQHDREIIRSLQKNGVKMSDIARSYKVHPSTIRYHCKEACKNSKRATYLRHLVKITPTQNLLQTAGDYIRRYIQ